MNHVEKQTLHPPPPPFEADDDAARVLVPHPEATCEVRAEDVLEAIDLRRGSRVTYRSSGDHPSSIAPLAIDTIAPFDAFEGPDATRPPAPRPPPSKRIVGIVSGVLGVAVVILAVAGIRALVTKGHDADAAKAAATAPTPPPAATAATINADALPSVPTTGTIVFAKKTSASVDGAKVTAGSAVVRCGSHTVKQGRASARKIDVPCGGTVVVQ